MIERNVGVPGSRPEGGRCISPDVAHGGSDCRRATADQMKRMKELEAENARTGACCVYTDPALGVILAKAGIHWRATRRWKFWMPAFARMTEADSNKTPHALAQHIQPMSDLERGVVHSKPHAVEATQGPVFRKAMPWAERQIFAAIPLLRRVKVLQWYFDAP